MGMPLRRRDPVVPGTTVAPAAREPAVVQSCGPCGTAWWPRFAVAGVVLTVIGVTLLSGAAQALPLALAGFGGAVVFVFAVTWGLRRKSWDQVRARPEVKRHAHRGLQ